MPSELDVDREGKTRGQAAQVVSQFEFWLAGQFKICKPIPLLGRGGQAGVSMSNPN
jgi:hypothetical protein